MKPANDDDRDEMTKPAHEQRNPLWLYIWAALLGVVFLLGCVLYVLHP